MCGRYAQTQEMREFSLRNLLSLASSQKTRCLLVGILRQQTIFISCATTLKIFANYPLHHGGMIGPWLTDEAEARASQSRAINARSESIHEKPTFRDSFKSRRCLIPADGYYEWATELGRYKTKQPFYISSDEGKSLPIAGIWNTWRSPSGALMQSASIITREAVGELATIHHRMPVMMPKDRWSAWLDVKNTNVRELINMMSTQDPAAHLHPVPVSDAVNKVANNGPQLAVPISITEPETLFQLGNSRELRAVICGNGYG
jgi:putative SOS response-associated peptidase YedK